MKTIRTKISKKTYRSPLRSIRIRSNNPYFHNIISAASRYDNRRSSSRRNLNIIRQVSEYDDNLEGNEENENINSEVDTSPETNEDNESTFNSEEDFQEFQSRIIEERNLNTSYSGDYGPYFPNATIFMLFTWCTKHMISKLLFIYSRFVTYPFYINRSTTMVINVPHRCYCIQRACESIKT